MDPICKELAGVWAWIWTFTFVSFNWFQGNPIHSCRFHFDYFSLNWTGPYHARLLPLVNHFRITWKPLNKWHYEISIWWVEMYIDTSICDAFVCTLVVPFVVGGGNISSKVGHKNDIKAVALPIKSSAQREIKVGRPATYIQILWHAPASELPNAIEWILKNLWMKRDGKLIVFTPWSFQIERLAAKFSTQNHTIKLIA